MANNALIQGAALTGKKFLDVGAAAAQGIASLGNGQVSNDRVAKNKAIQSRVNNYMSKMKTDIDFTSFSPKETSAMRNFLLGERTKYTDAAKMAASFDDTTDPDYMQYVDTMQSVNNSFTNLASQLGSYKKSKLEYAQTMQEGLFSNGNDDARSLEAATIYGFIDEDKDGRSDKRLDAPFQIQNGGNIAFNVGGQEVLFNNMEEPFLKDTKFLNGLSKTSETAYNSGLSGKSNNPYAQKAYNQSLDDALQNEDTLRSIIFDFQAEAELQDVGKDLDNNVITLEEARGKVKTRLLKAREDAFKDGKAKYDAKKRKQDQLNDTLNNPEQIAANKAAEFRLSQGVGDVELYHPSQPNKKQKFNIRPTSSGGFEIGLVGGNMYSPLDAENVFNIDITKIKLGSAGSSGGDDIGFNQKLYDDIKAALSIKGDPTPEQHIKIMEQYNNI